MLVLFVRQARICLPEAHPSLENLEFLSEQALDFCRCYLEAFINLHQLGISHCGNHGSVPQRLKRYSRHLRFVSAPRPQDLHPYPDKEDQVAIKLFRRVVLRGFSGALGTLI
jgi:hypothetical protein